MISTYEAIIQDIIDYIEAHLFMELSLSTLAKQAGFSEFHFLRVFQAMTGTTVMDYLRKRRLICAANKVAYSNERLLDIALDCGFSTPETFTRAFRRLYGMTPGEYRKRGIQPPAYPKVSVMQPCYNSYLGGIQMNYEIVTKPAFDIIGYSILTTSQEGENSREIPAFWKRYMEEKLGQTLYDQAASNAEYGICAPCNLETGEFKYIIGVEAHADAVVPEDAERHHITEQTYAVFTTPRVPQDQFTDSIQATWQTIFSEWFPHSGYEHSGAPDFEYYDERCWSDRNELVEMDIYIPVKKKN